LKAVREQEREFTFYGCAELKKEQSSVQRWVLIVRQREGIDVRTLRLTQSQMKDLQELEPEINGIPVWDKWRGLCDHQSMKALLPSQLRLR
jgi:hypothetical protein